MDWLNDYKTLLSFPSVSSEPEYEQDLLACFEWVKKEVEAIGFETEVWDTGGHPTLFGSWLKAPGKPTLLIYNHYDVQPVDPLELWETPPFEPTVIDNVMYARGAQDNKGQLFYVMLALKTVMKEKGAFPLNIKWLIEGEEEVGSKNLPAVLFKNSEKLKADHLAIVDGGIPGKDMPAVSLGMRGLVTMDVELTGTRSDLHSGSHGGLAYNPAFALAELLAAAKNREGKITIPGFYDSIKPLTVKEKESLDFHFNEQKYLETYGAGPSGGERSLTPLERNWLRPTFEVNGIVGGYTGAGFKTVIPAKASAKISCRLVRGQDPQEMGKLVARWLDSMAPNGITVRTTVHPGGGPAVLTSPDAPVVKAFAKAFSDVFKKPCHYILEGASIPIVADLQQASGADSVLIGLGLGTDQIHAPNEHFSLDRIEKGRDIMMRALDLLS